MGVRAVKANFAAAGSHVVVCRRAEPLAALIPVRDLDRFRELARRDEELAEVLRRRGFDVESWSTAGILDLIASRLGAPGLGSGARGLP